jgi:maltose O-acetyltransferase
MGEHKQRMLAGDWYLFAGDDEIAADSRRRVELCTAYNDGATSDARRRELLEQLLGSVGEDVTIRPPFQCEFGAHISVGPRTFVNFNAVFLDVAPITVGADCQIGPGVQLLTPNHELDAERRRAGWENGTPVTLGDNVWLGGGVIVCPGVTIGENTVVGAGSVVNKDLPAGVLAVGNPARIVREL